MKKVLLVLTLLLGTMYVFGVVTFTDQTHPIPGVYKSSVAWGDFDNDGDFDLLIAGQISVETSIARIYRNNAGTFVDIGAGLPGFSSASVAWADYDNDGDIDFAICGLSGGIPLTRIYNNSAGEFSPHTSASLTGLESGALAWGDADNDGDLDLLVTGRNVSGVPQTILYYNTLASFSTFTSIATAVWSSSVAWCDFDNDGDLDFVLSGATTTAEVTEIWRNTAGAFAKLTVGVSSILGMSVSSVAWADYDNDGDMDLFIAGKRLTTYYTKLYRNDLLGNTSTFVDADVSLPGVQNSSLALGDYDNDGDFDLLLTGEYTDGSTTTNISRIYRNNDTVFFYDTSFVFPGVRFSSIAWGDYDNDRDLDFILTGLDNAGAPVTKIYKSSGAAANLAPLAPTGLGVELLSTGYIKFSWTPSSDAITPAMALTYALRIGTSSGGVQILPSHASSAGYRRLPGFGYAKSNCSWLVKASAVPLGSFYWSVQTLDGAFIGSTWATQASFNGGRILSPNGGENWQAGSTKSVYWYTNSDVNNLNIFFSSNNGVDWTQVGTNVVSNLGRYAFTVPSVSSTACLMKIVDTVNPALSDVSDGTFTVSPDGGGSSITVTYPNAAGIKLQVGKQYYLSWVAINVANVKVELSLDEGQTWATAVASVPGAQGSYLYTVPDTPAPLCYFRISSTSNPALYDWNDNPFAIVKLSVTFPNAGDHVMPPPPTANKLNVAWVSSGITTLKVELSINGGETWRSLVASTPAISGTYAGTISVADISTNCLVRITDTADASVTASSSGLFTIADMDITHPSASGIKLQMGRTYPITWTQVGVNTTLRIQYATNYTTGSADWITIASGVPASAGQYDWTVPVTASSATCRVRIVAQNQESYADISDNNFTISSLTLTSPNGGETWFSPPVRTITWQHAGVTTLKIELSMDGGGTYPITVAASVTASSGIYSWTANEYNSPNCKIRLTDTGSAGNVYDESDAVFTLYQRLQVLMPNGGETLIAGSTYNIRWRAEPDIPTIKLYYSANNGTSWTTITATAINSALGTYAWTVPGTLGSDYLIQARRDPATSPNTIDTSDAKFTVSNTIPAVAFIGNPVSGYQPLTVQFTDQTPMLSAPITSWLWNFGDGQTSTVQNPSHVYQNVGTYSVTLTVYNSIDAPRTLTKANYVQVNANLAQIQLLTEVPLVFYASVGQSTAWAEVRFKNIGTSNLMVSSVTCAGTGFSYQYANLNTPILPDSTDVIMVRFTPTSTSLINGTLTLNSNASNSPALPVSLIGNDLPVAVTGLVVNIVDESAVLTWNAVIQSVGGGSITPDMYIIEYNETPYENVDNLYYYLWATPTTTFTHYLVARYADYMFYRVRAVMNLSPAQREYLMTLGTRKEKLTWYDVERRLAELKE